MKYTRMGLCVLLLTTFIFSSASSAGEDDVIKIDAKRSAVEAVEALKELLGQQRFKIISVDDYGDDESIKRVISFGKSNQYARILWHDPAASLELPLKIAVLQDDVGTQVVYRKPTSLRDTYSLQDCRLMDDLDEVMADLAQQAAQ